VCDLAANDEPVASDQRFAQNEPSVVADVVDGETIIMNLEKGDYYSLNQSGGEVWALVVAGLRRIEIFDAIARRYEGKPSPAEIDGFIGELLKHRLILAADRAGVSAGLDKLLSPGKWSAPELSVYSDMKDLLAMDPPMPLAKTARN
jgi:coenzyme PQQ synthesis protein D (PqqD)